MRVNKTTFPAAEIVPASLLEPLDSLEVFGRVAPLEVDLGCGDGSFLASLAQANPDRDFIGIERMPGRVRGAGRKIGTLQLSNARVIRFEILHATQQLFRPGAVAVFHLKFPDPWPKRRHQNRRVVTGEFLRAVARALSSGGELRIATDEAEYFRQMQRLLLQAPMLAAEPHDQEDPKPTSTFEERFHERGLPIHRLLLRKRSALEMAGLQTNCSPPIRPIQCR